jgi:hypothetical protein
MFEISVTREFEDWYQALDSESAEKIAAELNVLERLGPELDSERSSPMLLWFDGLRGGVPLSGLGLRESGWELSHLLRRQHEALRCLETPDFLARFLKLEPRQARRGHELVERLRASVGAANLQLLVSRRQTQLALVLVASRAPSRLGAAPPAAREGAWPGEGVQAALLEVLSFVGLRLEDVADRSSGLRELTVAGLAPPHRLVYAIDAPRRRILAILGEALDHAYYGDSVRLAERRWRDYCRTLPVSGEAR